MTTKYKKQKLRNFAKMVMIDACEPNDIMFCIAPNVICEGIDGNCPAFKMCNTVAGDLHNEKYSAGYSCYLRIVRWYNE